MLTKDCDGYVYWNGVQVEHYSFRDPLEELHATNELRQRCIHLERIGVPVTCSNVIWHWEWFKDMRYDDKYKHFLSDLIALYVGAHKDDVIIGYKDGNYYDRFGNLVFSKLDDDRIWNAGGLVTYHHFRALGYRIADVGQAPYQGILYADRADIVKFLAERNVQMRQIHALPHYH